MAETEPKLECPYNKYHRILPDRFQTHLVKCRKQYPDEKKVQCPYNATHVIGECEFKYHVDHCEDVKSLTSHLLEYKDDKSSFFQPERKFATPINCSENWDDVAVPTYDPADYTAQVPILRIKQGSAPSERRKFRTQERQRVSTLRHGEQQNSTPHGSHIVNVREPRSALHSVTERPASQAESATNSRIPDHRIEERVEETRSELSCSVTCTSTPNPSRASSTASTSVQRLDETPLAMSPGKFTGVGRGRSFPNKN